MVVIELPRAHLQGDMLDLSNLATLLGESGPHRVTKDDEGFWLVSDDFRDAVHDPEEVRRRATAALATLNGLATLRFPGFRPVEIAQAVDWLREDGRVKRRLQVRLKFHVRAANRAQDAIPSIVDDSSIAQHNAKVAEALSIYGGGDLTWDRLARVFEIARDDVGNRVLTSWIPGDSVRRFWQTVNSKNVIGEEARHAVQTGPPPKDPMSIDEARALIQALLDAWIRSKR